MKEMWSLSSRGVNKQARKPEIVVGASLVVWSMTVTWGPWSRASRKQRSEPSEDLGKGVPGRGKCMCKGQEVGRNSTGEAEVTSV